MEKVQAKVGDNVIGDEWPGGNYAKLGTSEDYKDDLFPGCDFRLEDTCGKLIGYAVNIKVTGKPRWDGWSWHSRCKIEIVGDGEPSTFFGGLLFHKNI